MGYDRIELGITARVSRHGSERDTLHDELWARAKARLDEVLDDPEFEEIELGWGNLW